MTDTLQDEKLLLIVEDDDAFARTLTRSFTIHVMILIKHNRSF